MKILIVTVSQMRGGAEEYTLKIARGAIQAGHTVDFALPDTEGTQTLQAEMAAMGASYTPLDIGDDDVLWCKHRKVAPLWRTLQRTHRVLKKRQPDLVLIAQPSLRCAFGPILACAQMRVPALVVFQLVSSVFQLKKIEVALYRWARSRRQQWVAISRNNAELAGKSFQCAPDEFHVIYNGVPVPEPLPDSEKQNIRSRIRKELDVAEDTPLLLTVGRLHVQKGLTYLAEAMPAILEKHPSVQFVWAGDGPEQDALTKQMQENGSAHAVHLLGHRTDINDLLHAADLFVFPTLWEGGQSFALAEAMALGLPIITTDASGIPEVVTHEEHGLICPQKDSGALAKAVIFGLDHPEDMARMAKTAYERVQEFSEDIMVNETLKIAADCAEGTP